MTSKIIYIVLIALLVASIWQWRSVETQLKDSQVELARMESHAQGLEKKVFALEQQLAETQKSTINGIAEEANSLLLEGWDAVLEEFGKKLEETKKRMSEKLNQNNRQNSDAQSDDKT